jgi:hypothetical protein
MSPTLRSTRSRLGQELSFGFEPIGTGIARQRESVSSFGNEVSPESNFLVGGLGRSFGLTARPQLCASCGGDSLSCRSVLFRGGRATARRGFLRLSLRSWCGGAQPGSTIVWVLSIFSFSWHGLK